MITNRGDLDDFAVARDVMDYLCGEVDQAALATLYPKKAVPADEVFLKDGPAVLKVNRTALSRLYAAAFDGKFKFSNWLVSPADVQALTEQAGKAGDADLAARLVAFKQAMTGTHAIVVGKDGNRWTPQPVAKQSTEKPAEFTRAAEMEALANEVSDFFCKGEDDE